MISKPQEFRFAARVRKRLIELLRSIEDSNPFDRFNDRSPNWVTRRKLDELMSDFEEGITSLGAIAVIAHGSCGNANHDKLSADKNGYWLLQLAADKTILSPNRDSMFSVEGRNMETDFCSIADLRIETCEPCPCARNKRNTQHGVARYFIWPQDATSRIREIAKAKAFMRDARDLCEDKRSRAAIREQLLEGLLHLERLIVQKSAEEEVAERMKNP